MLRADLIFGMSAPIRKLHALVRGLYPLQQNASSALAHNGEGRRMAHVASTGVLHNDNRQATECSHASDRRFALYEPIDIIHAIS